MPEHGSTTPAFDPQASLETTGQLQSELFPQLQNTESMNLPASATIPQSSFSLPKPSGALVKPSVYPVPPKGPPAAKQASWTDVQLRSSSQQDPSDCPVKLQFGAETNPLGIRRQDALERLIVDNKSKLTRTRSLHDVPGSCHESNTTTIYCCCRLHSGVRTAGLRHGS